MAEKKPKQPTNELYFDPPYISGVGSFSLYREDIKRKKPDTVIQGFVRKEIMGSQAKRRK